MVTMRESKKCTPIFFIYITFNTAFYTVAQKFLLYFRITSWCHEIESLYEIFYIDRCPDDKPHPLFVYSRPAIQKSGRQRRLSKAVRIPHFKVHSPYLPVRRRVNTIRPPIPADFYQISNIF